MNRIKIYKDEKYRSYDDLENYYPGITTECFKDWEEMAEMANTVYGYPVMKRCTDLGAKEHQEEMARKTIKLEALKSSMVERWLNENIEDFIGGRLDGKRCDIDMELENLIFNIVDGNVTKSGHFKSRFLIGDIWFSIPKILIDFIKNR